MKRKSILSRDELINNNKILSQDRAEINGRCERIRTDLENLEKEANNLEKDLNNVRTKEVNNKFSQLKLSNEQRIYEKKKSLENHQKQLEEVEDRMRNNYQEYLGGQKALTESKKTSYLKGALFAMHVTSVLDPTSPYNAHTKDTVFYEATHANDSQQVRQEKAVRNKARTVEKNRIDREDAEKDFEVLADAQDITREKAQEDNERAERLENFRKRQEERKGYER